MDAYSVTRWYHIALTRFYEDHRDDDVIGDNLICLNDWNLASFLVPLFKMYPMHGVLLLSSDGRIAHVGSMNDAAPASFHTRRYMKIENKSSASSIKSILSVLFQLLSIDVDVQQRITVLDAIGLLQFLLHLLGENPDIDTSGFALFAYLRRQFWQGPDFAKQWATVDWRAVYRTPIVAATYDDPERMVLGQYEKVMERFLFQQRITSSMVDTVHELRQRLEYVEDMLIRIVNAGFTGKKEPVVKEPVAKEPMFLCEMASSAPDNSWEVSAESIPEC